MLLSHRLIFQSREVSAKWITGAEYLEVTNKLYLNVLTKTCFCDALEVRKQYSRTPPPSRLK